MSAPSSLRELIAKWRKRADLPMTGIELSGHDLGSAGYRERGVLRSCADELESELKKLEEAALAAQHAPLKYPEKCPTCGVQAQPGSFDMGFAPFPAQREMTDEEKANLTHYYKKRRASSPSKEGGK